MKAYLKAGWTKLWRLIKKLEKLCYATTVKSTKIYKNPSITHSINPHQNNIQTHLNKPHLIIFISLFFNSTFLTLPHKSLAEFPQDKSTLISSRYSNRTHNSLRRSLNISRMRRFSICFLRIWKFSSSFQLPLISSASFRRRFKVNTWCRMQRSTEINFNTAK
jgi:hypothetical protein